VIEAKFMMLGRFSEGLLSACDRDTHCGYIDETGKWVIEPRFAGTGEFSQGLAAVLDHVGGFGKSGGFGYIDRTGRYVIEPKYSEAESFRDGLARVRLRDSYTYITRDGKLLR